MPIADLNQFRDEPLIWTSKGNLPQSKLRCIPMWRDTPTAIEFVLEYYDPDDEQLIKRDVHVFQKLTGAG